MPVPRFAFTYNGKGEVDVPIKGVAYKQAAAATFTITLDGKFLPPQLIYGDKISRCLPKFEFTDSFSLSFNENHFSKTNETKKLIAEVLAPYLDNERGKLQLDPDQKGLVVLDFFVVKQMKNHAIASRETND